MRHGAPARGDTARLDCTFFNPKLKGKAIRAGRDPLACSIGGSACTVQLPLEMQAHNKGRFSISPHSGARATPAGRGVLWMLPSSSTPFPLPRQGLTGPVLTPPGRSRGGGQLPGTIKDAGHHAKGKGSTKKRQRLRAALQCPPH